MAVEMTWNTGNVINVQTLDYQYLFIYYLTSSFHQERKDEKSVHFILSCKRRLKQTSDKSVLRVNTQKPWPTLLVRAILLQAGKSRKSL